MKSYFNKKFTSIRNWYKVISTLTTHGEKLSYIANHYDLHREVLNVDLKNLVNIMREHTSVHADVHLRQDDTQVVVLGKWKNRDYVRIFDVDSKDLGQIIRTLEGMEGYHKRGRTDLPHGVPSLESSRGMRSL